MVLTRRQYKAISRWLPNEVTTLVIQAAPRADQVTLCRVSKLFHALSMPVVYRIVHLKDPSEIQAFCSAVLSNPALPQLVRSVVYQDISGSFAKVYSGMMLDSLRTLLRLERLWIDVDLLLDEHLAALLRCTFPRLVACRVGVGAENLVDPLASFLARHSSLKSLLLDDSNSIFQAPFPIPLPCLEYYNGSVDFAHWIVAGSLKEGKFNWNSRKTYDIEKTIVAVKTLTASDVPFVCSHYWCDEYFAEILESMSSNLPHMKSLQMHPYSNDTDFAHVRNCLPRFTHLEILCIAGVKGPESEQLITVQGFANLCPTLEWCRLGERAWRKINQGWERYPLIDFMIFAGV
ncbi:hypothetical protein B0H11DRAFT_2275746 [Mycena galericulata]|nr:hypothetical protein B0H11DRAFT_2275746 [Mycena galericulata]